MINEGWWGNYVEVNSCALIGVLSWHFSGGTEEKHETSQVTWPGVTWIQVHEQYHYTNQFSWLKFVYSLLHGESFKIWSDWVMFKNIRFFCLWNELKCCGILFAGIHAYSTMFLWSTNSLNTFLFISLLTDCTAHALCYCYYCITTTVDPLLSKNSLNFPLSYNTVQHKMLWKQD